MKVDITNEVKIIETLPICQYYEIYTKFTSVICFNGSVEQQTINAINISQWFKFRALFIAVITFCYFR